MPPENQNPNPTLPVASQEPAPIQSPQVPPAGPTVSAPLQTPPLKSNKKVVIILLAIIIVLLLAGGAYVFFFNKKDSNNTPTPNTPATTKKETPKVTESAACLTRQDYIDFMGEDVDDTLYKAIQENNYTGNVHFKADSVEYEDDMQITFIEEWGKFVKDHPTLKYKILLDGHVNADTGSTADKQLAKNRAEKVMTDMIKNGVPADKISINPDYVTDSSDTGSLSRAVVFTLVNLCTSKFPNGSADL